MAALPARLRRRRARDPGALSGPLAAVSFVASLVALNALSDARYPTPGADPSVIGRYFSQEHRAARLGAVAQLMCAGCVARFTKSVATLAERAGRSSGSLKTVSVAGGTLAASSLATSALTTAVLTTERVRSDTGTNRLYRLMFVTGGPVHGVGLALLTGCLGLAGIRTGDLPPRLSKAALASCAAGALSPLALVAKPALVFIPLGRLSALAVSAVAGARLARPAR